MLTRQALGMQQNAFCLMAGFAANTYNQHEKGRARPNLDNAIKLVRTHHITLDWIYLGDPSGLRLDYANAIKAILKARSNAGLTPCVAET